jgi:hypothetical protein
MLNSLLMKIKTALPLFWMEKQNGFLFVGVSLMRMLGGLFPIKIWKSGLCRWKQKMNGPSPHSNNLD